MRAGRKVVRRKRKVVKRKAVKRKVVKRKVVKRKAVKRKVSQAQGGQAQDRQAQGGQAQDRQAQGGQAQGRQAQAGQAHTGEEALVRKICAVALLGSLVASLQLSAAEPAPDALRVYGNTSTIELAPVLLAVDRIHPSPVRIVNGGVPNLFKPGEAELATNAETQALRASVDNPGLRIILTVSEGVVPDRGAPVCGRRQAG